VQACLILGMLKCSIACVLVLLRAVCFHRALACVRACVQACNRSGVLACQRVCVKHA
jgi:hypothetical protein